MPKRRNARQTSRREFLKGSAAVAAVFAVAGEPCFAKKAHAAGVDRDSRDIADGAPALAVCAASDDVPAAQRRRLFVLRRPGNLRTVPSMIC
jgi:hypothetical protein